MINPSVKRNERNAHFVAANFGGALPNSSVSIICWHRLNPNAVHVHLNFGACAIFYAHLQRFKNGQLRYLRRTGRGGEVP